MQLENIKLSEVRDRNANTAYSLPYMGANTSNRNTEYG